MGFTTDIIHGANLLVQIFWHWERFFSKMVFGRNCDNSVPSKPKDYDCHATDWCDRKTQAMVTLLQTMHADRQRHDADARELLLAQLARALHDLIPGQAVIVFGSLAKPLGFNRHSDVDLALEVEPSGMSAHALASVLLERLGRRVDVVLLGECRFAEKIRREGIPWIA